MTSAILTRRDGALQHAHERLGVGIAQLVLQLLDPLLDRLERVLDGRELDRVLLGDAQPRLHVGEGSLDLQDGLALVLSTQIAALLLAVLGERRLEDERGCTGVQSVKGATSM